MDEREKLARIRLIQTRHIGPMTFSLLIQCYGSAVAALAAILELELAGQLTRHYGNRVSRQFEF